MTNLGGHDLDLVREVPGGRRRRPAALLHRLHDQGLSLPFGHKDNHAGLMTPEQMAEFKKRTASRTGRSGTASPASTSMPTSCRLLEHVPFATRTEEHDERRHPGAGRAAARPARPRTSTQEAFGRIMGELARDEGELAARIITTSPDVTVSTSLGPGSAGAACSIAPSTPMCSSRSASPSSQLWGEPARPARRARHRREQPVPDAGGARHVRAAVRPAPDPDRHAVRPVHRPWPRCPDLRELSGRALPRSRRRRAFRWHPRRRPSVGRDAADRHRPARAAELRARATPTSSRKSCASPSTTCKRGRRLGLSALSTRAIEQPEREMTEELRRRSCWRLLAARAGRAELALVGAGAILPECLRRPRRALADDLPARDPVITSADRLLEDWREVQERRAQGDRQRRDGASCWRRSPPMPRSSPCSTASGHACLARQRHRPPGLPARRRPLRPVRRHSPICTAFIGSMPTRSSIAWRSPAPNAPDAPRPDGAAAPSDPLDPVAGRLRPRRQQRRRPAAAAARLRRVPAQYRAAGAPSGLRRLARAPSAARAAGRDPWRPRGARRARAVRGGAQRYLGDPGVADVVVRAVAAVRAAHPGAPYCRDPASGTTGPAYS